MPSRIAAAVALAFLVSLLSGAAHASLLGSSVTARVAFPTLSAPTSPTVGPVIVDTGVEFTGQLSSPLPVTFIDIGDAQVTIALPRGVGFSQAAFNGIALDFAGAPAITSVTVDPLSTALPTSIAFTASEIAIDYAGLSIPRSFYEGTILDVTTASSVPEPSHIALLVPAICALLALRRRRFPADGSLGASSDTD